MEASDRELRRRDLTMFARTSWSLEGKGGEGEGEEAVERDGGRQIYHVCTENHE